LRTKKEAIAHCVVGTMAESARARDDNSAKGIISSLDYKKAKIYSRFFHPRD
jgi:hypothetical protein